MYYSILQQNTIVYGNLLKYTSNLLQYTSKILQYTSNLLQYTSNLLQYTSNLLKYTSKILQYNSKILQYTATNYSILATYYNSMQAKYYSAYSSIRQITIVYVNLLQYILQYTGCSIYYSIYTIVHPKMLLYSIYYYSTLKSLQYILQYIEITIVYENGPLMKLQRSVLEIQSCLIAIFVIYHLHAYIWFLLYTMNICMLVRIPKSDIYIFGYRYLQIC